MVFQATKEQIHEERRITDAMEARSSFDTLDVLLSNQQQRLRDQQQRLQAQWTALQQARTAAANARHAAARAANAPYISGSLPPAA